MIAKVVGVLAILLPLVSGYAAQTTYTEAVNVQAQQISAYSQVLEAFNSWQISDYPVLSDWVNQNLLGTVLKSPEVAGSGAVTVLAWIMFVVMKLKRKE